MGTGIFYYRDLAPPSGAPAFWTQLIFEGPTSCLGKLHARLSMGKRLTRPLWHQLKPYLRLLWHQLNPYVSRVRDGMS